MKIIYIGKSRYYQDTIINQLKDFSEQDSIAFFYTYSEAEQFINNNIINNQIALDLIIVENNVGLKKATDFLQNIIKDKERTYSCFDFRFCEIPVILIADRFENRTAFLNYPFSEVIDFVGHDRLHLFLSNFQSVVKTWRRKVLDELDNLGIIYNSGFVDYSYFLVNNNRRYVPTRVLSENFQRFPRQLKYDWLVNNEKQIEKAIDDYVKELKRAERLNNKKEEKRFHRLFNKYPFFLKRDNYRKHWYEPRLHYTETEYYEPDYSLQPNFNQRTDLSILEVKLPNEAFLKKKGFHRSPYNRVIEHIFQLKDYKDYLESDEYYSEIEKVFGYVPNNIEYNILVGRLDDKTEGFKLFNKRLKDINSSYINFITYDELLQYQVQFLERTRVLKIL